MNFMRQILSLHQALSHVTSITSIKQMKNALLLFQTKKNHKKKILMLLESIFSLFDFINSDFSEFALLKDMIFQTVCIVHEFSKYHE